MTAGNPDSGRAAEAWVGESMSMLVTIRWVLVIAIAYLVTFSNSSPQVPTSTALFVALYLGSNVLFAELARDGRREWWLEWAVVVLDVGAVTTALWLVGEGAAELFVLYFVVVFLSALLDGVLLAVGAAVLIGVAHLYTASTFVDAADLIQNGYVVRLPFLFAVALFFGHLVQTARARQRSMRERELRAQRMEILSTVSHDLRNPLGVIDSLTELLIEGDAGELNLDQLSLARRIQVSIRQVLHLSNNLIDAERIELNNFKLRAESCDLTSVVEESLVVAAGAAQLRGVSLRSDLPGRVSMAMDAVQVERAVSNLIGNAIKFTPRGGEVAVDLAIVGDHIEVAVTDDGPGFPESVLADLGRKHLLGGDVKGAGSGLGLFIADAVMKAHGGWLSAENRPDGGARVALHLPIAADDRFGGDFVEPYLAQAG